MYTIIAGTNRKGSNTLKVAEAYLEILKEKNIEARLVSLVDLDVLSRNAAVKALEEGVLIPTEKFLFIVPEYNGSFPGVLKALMDNSDIAQVWWGKKALLTGVSTGRAGNLRGLEHLTGILHYLRVWVLPNKLPISVVDKLMDPDGRLIDEDTLRVMRQQVDEFISF